MFTVEVVIAWPDRAERIALQLPVGATVAHALDASGLRGFVGAAGVGIYGLRVDESASLAPGDRIEIYRPLDFDPMESRRRRAAAAARRR
jgi:hypothetical protein